MTAVANPPSFQHNNRSAWGASVGQGGLNSMNTNEVARMFMPRKSAQRANSSSSVSSNSSASSTATISAAPSPQANGTPMPPTGDLSSWGTAAPRKKPPKAGPWPATKPEVISGSSTTRPQSVLAPGNPSSAPSMTPAHQPSSIVPSQNIPPNPAQQTNGARPTAQASSEANPVLYLLSMNGTFERKTISVPYYPESLRIGRQTNAKTVPTPANGYFDSKVLSRQHAEVWADRNGKVWIRDVKSSNGTFVNGARLSPENRDSEPHELLASDHLELGIDIVSEDQKTVVHHKVAAKIEYAGYSGATSNVLEMNFGDLDPGNGAMMVPSQGALQARGRSGSQGSVGSNSRLGPPSSVAGSQMGIMGQQRPMNFWLTPVTTEHIVKRLTNEMRAARLQTNDLERADHFFDVLLSKGSLKNMEGAPAEEPPQSPQVNGVSPLLRTDAKTRFSDPPAPPPQQPLPEKPDVARSSPSEMSPPSLKRAGTERPRSVTTSPITQESNSQIISLLGALASAKKEIDIQSAQLRDLKELLLKERQARELAEELAKQLELQSSEPKTNGHEEGNPEGLIIEEAFQPPADRTVTDPAAPEPRTESPLHDHNTSRDGETVEPSSPESKVVDTKAISASTSLLERRMETMRVEMQELRDHMESFKKRAETAEAERDEDRKTLAEMVGKIRLEESIRRSALAEAVERVPADQSRGLANSASGAPESTSDSLLEKAGHVNGDITPLAKDVGTKKTGTETLSKLSNVHDPRLYHATPYASMLGVVLIGMGLMAYLNGWQPPKAD